MFGPAFRRNSRWSVAQPVPEVGDPSAAWEHTSAFYDFWFTFRSWREFPHPDEEDTEQAESREERRWALSASWLGDLRMALHADHVDCAVLMILMITVYHLYVALSCGLLEVLAPGICCAIGVRLMASHSLEHEIWTSARAPSCEKTVLQAGCETMSAYACDGAADSCMSLSTAVLPTWPALFRAGPASSWSGPLACV